MEQVKNDLLLEPSAYKETLGLDLEQIVSAENQFAYLSACGNIQEKLAFTDFDDTLYSRTPQLTEDRFAKNRGKAGNDLVEFKIGFTNFFEKYYNPELVVSELAQKTDIILTAGRERVQKGKMEYTGLDYLDDIIVKEHKYKPRAILDYCLKNKTCPKVIEFYDDKAFALTKHFQHLSKLMQNTIILKQVQLSKDTLNQVENIDEIIIQNGEPKS
ncbi:hypothetical protein KGV52_00295 [Candidatus Gracilibacteria bacterium]|nr:hypothetical protein [Candidatus Gracilibacteria bacterium]